jgi:hypothetical protein
MICNIPCTPLLLLMLITYLMQVNYFHENVVNLWLVISIKFAYVKRLPGEPGWLGRYSDGLRFGLRVFDSRRGKKFSLSHTVYIGSGVQPASHLMGTRLSFPVVKRPGREGDHSPPSFAEVKNGGTIPPLSIEIS